MSGDPGKIGTLTSVTPPPIHARDASQFDRMSAYYVMNQDDSLRLDVDRGKFYRTFGDKKIDVLDLSHVSTMLRQNQGDGYQRVGDLLGHLPTDQQLAATLPKPAPTPTYGNPQPTNNYGKPVSQPPTNYGTPVAYYPPTPPPPAPTPPTPPAPPAPPATPPPPVVVQQPPAPQPHPPVLGHVINGTFVPNMPFLPTREPLPNSGGAVPALDKLVAERNAGTISGNDFNLELLRIAQQTGAIRTNVNNVGPARTGDFNLTAHRYWDSSSGGYVNVSEILLSGGINPNDELRVFNPQGQNTLSLSRENVPLGNNMRVTVSWENGQQRIWDYQLREVGDTSVDVFTPAG
jgi:hypothetical protein